jgi:hypothetical protein
MEKIMALSWMERAEQELEDDLAQGHISVKEYNAGLRDIQSEYEQEREDAAQRAYDNY